MIKKKVRLLLFVCLVAVSLLAIDIRINLFNPIPVTAETQFELSAGTSLRSLAAQLRQREIIRRPGYFVVYARLNGVGSRLQAGEYSIKPGISAVGILEKMQKGEVKLYSFTIVEGWTFSQLLDALRKDAVLQHAAASSQGNIMQALGMAKTHPEGQFLPDTYLFAKGTTEIEFLRRAYAAMQKYLQSEWDKRIDNLPLRTPYEALILASIVEKETGKAEERPLIAAVFVNRLRKGMRLQTDPTVIYGIGETFDGNIRFRDLRQDTPYNTYTRAGLPPTPIALPGRDAIHAALHPAASTVLYFVAKGDGSHVFSDNLVDHEAAVDQYQRRRRNRNL